MDLARHFHFVGISGELGAWKPDPEAFRLALAPLGVAPHEALMVGDSIDFDLEPAKGLGMQTCWVNPAPEAASAHADVVVPTPGRLAAMLG
jgi:HAD superfamily hydrolase (TIGR01509 family)